MSFQSLFSRIFELDPRTRNDLVTEIQQNLNSLSPQPPQRSYQSSSPNTNTNINPQSFNDTNDTMPNTTNTNDDLDTDNISNNDISITTFHETKEALESSKQQYEKLQKLGEFIKTRELSYRRLLQQRAFHIKEQITLQQQQQQSDADADADDEAMALSIINLKHNDDDDDDDDEEIGTCTSRTTTTTTTTIPSSERTIQEIQIQHNRDMGILQRVSEQYQSIQSSLEELKKQIDEYTTKMEDILEQRGELEEFVMVAQQVQEEEEEKLEAVWKDHDCWKEEDKSNLNDSDHVELK